ncbi:MAG: Crp/Fnr family transcriptional regulator [Myxococcaceae bacterium]
MLRRAVHDCSDCELHTDRRCVFAPRTLQAGALLTPQGEVPSEVSFVRDGVVSTSTVAASGDVTGASVRGPRSLLGLEALRQLPSQAELRAVTPVALCSAPIAQVHDWLGPRGPARMMFEMTLDEVLEQRRDAAFRSGTAESRVARFTLVWSTLIGRGAATPISKTRVAALLGIRPETLSRVLTSFAERGLIERGKGITLKDADALRAQAE